MARSFLFIPGNVPRMLQNMDVFEADAVIIDFEDSVSASEKEDARLLTERFLTFHEVSVDVYIRINADKALMKADLNAIDSLPITGIVLPKASPDTLNVFEYLNEYKPCHVIALIETPDAFFKFEEIATHTCVKGLFLGGVDLIHALGGTMSKETLSYPRSHVLMAARAHGLYAIDTPWTTSDDDALARDAAYAASLGFDAKAAIHPNQVHPINQAFMPSVKRIEEAKRIVAMHEKHGSMRFSLDGQMIDKPVIDHAKALLEKVHTYQSGGENDV